MPTINGIKSVFPASKREDKVTLSQSKVKELSIPSRISPTFVVKAKINGKEVENNVIEFDSFITSSTRENRQSTEANYDEKMEKDLMNKLNNNQYNGFVVCHGHSHPRGSFSENFSLGDFTSYIQMNQENQVFKTKQAELIACLVTSTGDINFVFYDNTSNNFYRFTDVFVKDKDNNLTPVSCYGLNQRESANITNRILS